jgi:hypothetical protein
VASVSLANDWRTNAGRKARFCTFSVSPFPCDEDRLPRVPELLKHVQAADDLYFNGVSKSFLDRWSTARITLIGELRET